MQPERRSKSVKRFILIRRFWSSVQHRHQRTQSDVHCLHYFSRVAFNSPISWTVTISLFPLTAHPSPSPVIIPTSTWSKPGWSWPPAQPSPLRCHSDVFEITLMTLEPVLGSLEAKDFMMLIHLPRWWKQHWDEPCIIGFFLYVVSRRRRKQTFWLHFDSLLSRLLLGFRSPLSPGVRTGFIAHRPVVYSPSRDGDGAGEIQLQVRDTELSEFTQADHCHAHSPQWTAKIENLIILKFY